MGKKFVVVTSYPGYIFAGWAAGQFENGKGEKVPYANMFVHAPVSGYGSEDYKAFDMKMEKKCLSPEDRSRWDLPGLTGALSTDLRYGEVIMNSNVTEA